MKVSTWQRWPVGRTRRAPGDDGHHAEMIRWEHPRVRTRNRVGSEEIDGFGGPSGPFEKHAIEADVAVLVLAVVSHVIDGGVFGETVIVWPQHRPHIAVWRDDPSVLGVAHVEVAEHDRVVSRSQRTEDPSQLACAQPGAALAAVEMHRADNQWPAVDDEFSAQEP